MSDDLSEYLRAKEPGKAELAGLWRAAIGLQKVDGLTPSAYLVETARRNVSCEGHEGDRDKESCHVVRLLPRTGSETRPCRDDAAKFATLAHAEVPAHRKGEGAAAGGG